MRIVILIFFFISINLSQSSNKLNIIELKRLVNSKTESYNEFLLGHIVNVAFDKYGKIYLADVMDNCIKVYDKKFRFVKKIGRRGRGPGEFLEIKKIYIRKDGSLIAYDRGCFKICFFDKNLRFIKEQRFNVNLFDPIYFKEFDDCIIVLMSKYWSKNTFYVYDKNLEEKTNEFGGVLKQETGNKYLDEHLYLPINSLWNIFVLKGENEIIFSPEFYKGHLFKFTKKTNESWCSYTSNKFSLIKGVKLFNTRVYEINKQLYSHYLFTQNQRIYYWYNNISRGLYILNNNKIVHFIEIVKGNKVLFGAELYDENEKFIDFFIYDEIKKEDWDYNWYPVPLHVDKENNFYFLLRKGAPNIIKAKLVFGEEQ